MSPSDRATLEEARRIGLLSGDKAAHVSVRTTASLLEAAKGRTGIQSTTELIELALATLALPDPVTKYMLDNFGALGESHTLDL